MKLSRSDEKLEAYKQRLDSGKTAKITPEHIAKIIKKLKAKRAKVTDELAETAKTRKKDRLKRKLKTISDQLDRARWLKDQISKG